MAVGMIADLHFGGFGFDGLFIEQLGHRQPALFAFGLHVGDDEEFVANGLVKFNGLLEFVGLDRFQRGVRAASHQPVIIEHFAEVFGAVVVITGEFHALVTDLSHGFEGLGQILGASLADRVKLQAYGHFFAGRQQFGQADAQGGGTQDGGF